MLEHVKLIHGVLAADKKDLAEALKCVDDGEDQEEDLLHILEKSDQQLSKEEFLSDNIYYYDKYMGELISLF